MSTASECQISKSFIGARASIGVRRVLTPHSRNCDGGQQEMNAAIEGIHRVFADVPVETERLNR